MGLVIASGLSIGTLFTLLVVPPVYMRLGRIIRIGCRRRLLSLCRWHTGF